MSDTVVAALISAVASILVAILSKSVEARRASEPHGISSQTVRASSQANARRWYVTSAILLVWLALSPAFLHHDLAGENFFLIPVVAVLLSVIVPTSPLRAAWISLALFAANFVIGPLSNRLHGSLYDTDFLYDPRERSKQLFILYIGFGTAAVASCICYFRLPSGAVTKSPEISAGNETAVPRVDTHQIDTHQSLTVDLEKLSHLYATGALSVDEFRLAKKKLLDSHGSS